MATLVAVLLFGCASHDGAYSPDCIAYEGDKISLSDGQFVWEKFTDSVVVDDNGNVVNQHPGYPLQGTYRVDGQMLYLDAASGDSPASMHLQQHNHRRYLLTAEQFAAWEKNGQHADCVLVLGGRRDD